MTRVKTIVIVGAGLSGLRAAAILLRKRAVRVIVLEGRSRIGGRCHTSVAHSWCTPLDLGCAWIHGTQGNPLTPIAKATNSQYYELETSAVWDNGRWLQEEETSRLFDCVFGLGHKAVVYSKRCHDDIDPGRDFYSFCLETIDEDASLSEEEKIRAKKLAHFYTNVTAEEVTKQSLRNYLLEEELPGDSPMIASTYAPLLRAIAAPVTRDAGCLRLRQKVSRIVSHKDGAGVDVWVSDLERSGDEEYRVEADAVLITVPLGVLKADVLEFSPPLPERIRLAIRSLGMGTAEKLFVKFKTAFWMGWDAGECPPQDRDDRESVRRGGQEEEKKKKEVRDMYAFLPQSANEPLIEFISLAQFPINYQPVLLCFTAADVAHSLWTRWQEGGKQSVVDFVLPYLTKLPGYEAQSSACEIEDLFSTDWLHDEFSYGSYSFSPVGSLDTAKDCDVLARGVPESNVFFAGEHAADSESGYEIGTAHGAYSSGEHGANLILQHLDVKM